MGDTPTVSQLRDRRGALLAIGGLALLLGGLYLCGWLFIGGTVPDGTRVAGVDIGGLSPPEAERRLESELAERAAQPIRLTWQGRQFEIDPRRAGLRLDVEATVREAGGGRSWNPLRMVDNLLTPDEVAPVVDVDRKALDQELARLAKQIDRPPSEPVVRFDATGRHTIRYTKSGHTVDREAVAAEVVASYLRRDRPILLRIEEVETTAEVGDISYAVQTMAKPATSGPIRLKLPNRTVELRVPEFAPALSLRFRNGTFTPSFDVDRLRQTMARVQNLVAVPPRPARVTLRNGRPAIVPSAPGRRLDPARVAKAIAPVVTKTGPARSARITLSEWKAGWSTEDARRLGIRRIVSSARTPYRSAHFRNVNLRRATARLNGTVLRPGESFSFNRTIGPRTRANGFLKKGQGVSEAATATFNAAFYAGLQQFRRATHATYDRRYPLGRDAVVGRFVDLKFVNTTPYGVMIQAWIEPGSPKRRGVVHVRMWSTKYWSISARAKRVSVKKPPARHDRTRPCRARKGQPGFDVEVYRIFRRAGSAKVHHKETHRASYRPVRAVVCTRRGGRG